MAKGIRDHLRISVISCWLAIGEALEIRGYVYDQLNIALVFEPPTAGENVFIKAMVAGLRPEGQNVGFTITWTRPLPADEIEDWHPQDQLEYLSEEFLRYCQSKISPYVN